MCAFTLAVGKYWKTDTDSTVSTASIGFQESSGCQVLL